MYEVSPSPKKASVRAPFHAINNQESPVRSEFRELPLKAKRDPETKYVLDMVKMGSPSKDLDARRASRHQLAHADDCSVIVNRVDGTDNTFDNMWEDALHNKSSSSGNHLNPNKAWVSPNMSRVHGPPSRSGSALNTQKSVDRTKTGCFIREGSAERSRERP